LGCVAVPAVLPGKRQKCNFVSAWPLLPATCVGYELGGSAPH